MTSCKCTVQSDCLSSFSPQSMDEPMAKHLLLLLFKLLTLRDQETYNNHKIHTHTSTHTERYLLCKSVSSVVQDFDDTLKICNFSKVLACNRNSRNLQCLVEVLTPFVLLYFVTIKAQNLMHFNQILCYKPAQGKGYLFFHCSSGFVLLQGEPLDYRRLRWSSLNLYQVLMCACDLCQV